MKEIDNFKAPEILVKIKSLLKKGKPDDEFKVWDKNSFMMSAIHYFS